MSWFVCEFMSYYVRQFISLKGVEFMSCLVCELL